MTTQIPDLTQHGLLPPGVHDCTWHQFRARFATNPCRRAILKGLCQFLRKEIIPLNVAAPVLLDGSFVRSKSLPRDVDIVLDLSAFDLPAAAPAIFLWMTHRQRIKDDYAVDFWVKHPVIPNDLSAFFQYLGDKAASDLGLSAKWPKGILRVAP